MPWDHVVRPGESLWLISQRFKKNLNDIFRLNPQIRDKSKIWAGMTVHMPDPAPEGNVIVGPITFSQPSTVDPSIANAPFALYVDLFSECKYDVNYKVTNYFSTILQLKYADGTTLELDIERDFSLQNLTSEAARDAMAHGFIGRGGRIFPAKMVSRTVRRLWACRLEALDIQDEAFKDFARLAVTGVAFALSVPAMPAGEMEGAAVASSKVTRRSVPGVSGNISQAELQAVKAIRAANPEFANLTNEEIMAMRAYTGEDWAAINASLRGAGSADGNTSALASNVSTGLAKLPGYTGKLTRSEALPIKEAMARYVPGKPFSPEGMFSTSSAGSVAQREGNIAISIQAIGRQGKDISKLSVHAGTESEVLFAPGSKFMVEKATPIGENGLWVFLREQ